LRTSGGRLAVERKEAQADSCDPNRLAHNRVEYTKIPQGMATRQQIRYEDAGVRIEEAEPGHTPAVAPMGRTWT